MREKVLRLRKDLLNGFKKSRKKQKSVELTAQYDLYEEIHVESLQDLLSPITKEIKANEDLLAQIKDDEYILPLNTTEASCGEPIKAQLLEVQLEASQEKVLELESQLEKANQEKEQIEAQLEASQNEAAEAQEQIEAQQELASKAAEAKQQAAEAQQELASKVEELAAAKVQLAEANQQLEESQEKAVGLEARVEELAEANQQLEASQKQLEAKETELESKAEEAQKQIVVLEEKAAEAQQQSEQAKKKVLKAAKHQRKVENIDKSSIIVTLVILIVIARFEMLTPIVTLIVSLVLSIFNLSYKNDLNEKLSTYNDVGGKLLSSGLDSVSSVANYYGHETGHVVNNLEYKTLDFYN